MRISLIGRKQGMSQIFDENGNRIPVTVLTVGPCVVTQVKTNEKDGYASVQIGFDEKKASRVNKPMTGHFKKAGTKPQKTLREFRVDAADAAKFKPGMVLKADLFQPGDIVDVAGMSKGRGFAGVLKRHHMAGKDRGHGTHEIFRGGGSVGMRTWPARVIPGKRMAGHMGDERVTIQNLKVLEVHADKNAMLIKGSLPGHRLAMVTVQSAIKRPAPKSRITEAAPAEESAKAE